MHERTTGKLITSLVHQTHTETIGKGLRNVFLPTPTEQRLGCLRKIQEKQKPAVYTQITERLKTKSVSCTNKQQSNYKIIDSFLRIWDAWGWWIPEENITFFSENIAGWLVY